MWPQSTGSVRVTLIARVWQVTCESRLPATPGPDGEQMTVRYKGLVNEMSTKTPEEPQLKHRLCTRLHTTRLQAGEQADFHGDEQGMCEIFPNAPED